MGKDEGRDALHAGPKVSELVLDGATRPRFRRPSPRSWTREKESLFLQALAETCNVKLAAAEAGVSPQRAYERRRSDAAFRAGWAEAIASAYSRLELVLLDRALNGTEKIVRRRDGSEERMVDYSNQVALTLLKMHRETALEAEREVPEEDAEEARQSILRKLERLRERAAEAEDESAECR